MIGVPLDFRLGFGASFAPDAEIVVIDVAEPTRDHPRPIAAELYGPLPATLEALRAGATPLASSSSASSERSEWVTSLRGIENSQRGDEAESLSDPRAPLHPMRIYGELSKVLDRDAIVIGDGGDFVSFAGRLIDSYEPGCWLDPGPFGCLGSGPGYALAAKLAHPNGRLCCCSGTGRSASRAWSGTRSLVTAWPSWA